MPDPFIEHLEKHAIKLPAEQPLSKFFGEIPLPEHLREEAAPFLQFPTDENQLKTIDEKTAAIQENQTADEERYNPYCSLLEQHQCHAFPNQVRRWIRISCVELMTTEDHIKPELIELIPERHRKADPETMKKSLINAYLFRVMSEQFVTLLLQIPGKYGNARTLFQKYLNTLFHSAQTVDELLEKTPYPDDYQEALEQLDIVSRYGGYDPTLQQAGLKMHTAIKEAEASINKEFLTQLAVASKATITDPGKTENNNKLNDLYQNPCLKISRDRQLVIAITTLLVVAALAALIIIATSLSIGALPIMALGLSATVGLGSDIVLFHQAPQKKLSRKMSFLCNASTEKHSTPSTGSTTPSPPRNA